MIDKEETLKNILKNLLEERLSYLEKRNNDQMKDLKFEKEAFMRQELLVQRLYSIKIELKKPSISKNNKANKIKPTPKKSRDQTPIQKLRAKKKNTTNEQINKKRCITPDISTRNILSKKRETQKEKEKASLTKNKTENQLIKKNLKPNNSNSHNETKPYSMINDNEIKNNKKNIENETNGKRELTPDNKLKNKEPNKFDKNTENNLKLIDLKLENVKEPGTKKDKKEEKIETKKWKKTTKEKEEPKETNQLSNFDKIISKEKIYNKTSLYFDTPKKEEKNTKNQKHISKDINPIDNENDKKLITVIFQETDNSREYPIACNNTDIFSLVEEKLYKEHSYLKGINSSNHFNKVMYNLNKMFPNIIMKNNYDPNSMIGNNHICFYSNGIKVDKSKTLKENNIEDNTIILLEYSYFNQININFTLDNPKINYKISCFDIYLFSTIEQKLYKDNPKLEGKNISFKVKGKKIDKSLTLGENNIKNNATISMKIIAKIKINIKFISIDQKTKCSLTCFNSDFFSDIEKKLYKKVPELQKQYYFLCNGSVIEKSLTIAENKIQDKNIILIDEIDDGEDKANKLIAIILKTGDQSINCAISCYLKDKFSTIEEKLILKYPELKEKNMIFLFNARIVDKSATLEENNLKNGSVILIPFI